MNVILWASRAFALLGLACLGTALILPPRAAKTSIDEAATVGVSAFAFPAARGAVVAMPSQATIAPLFNRDRAPHVAKLIATAVDAAAAVAVPVESGNPDFVLMGRGRDVRGAFAVVRSADGAFVVARLRRPVGGSSKWRLARIEMKGVVFSDGSREVTLTPEAEPLDAASPGNDVTQAGAAAVTTPPPSAELPHSQQGSGTTAPAPIKSETSDAIKKP